MDYFLGGIEYAEREEFTRGTIITSLNNAISFDHELSKIIEIWEGSLSKYPTKYHHDTRQTYLAMALLDYSRGRPLYEAHELLRRTGETRPDNDGIIRQLRASVEKISSPHLERDYWVSRIEFSAFQHWQS